MHFWKSSFSIWFICAFPPTTLNYLISKPTVKSLIHMCRISSESENRIEVKIKSQMSINSRTEKYSHQMQYNPVVWVLAA